MEFRYERTSLLDQPTESCPFCAAPPGAAAITEVHRYDGMQRLFLIQITCRCGASGPACGSVVEATRAWNQAGEHSREEARLAS